MKGSLQIAYLGIEVPEPASLGSFFADVVGLLPGEPSVDGSTTWRNDDRAHRIIVRPGPANDAVFVGIEARDAASYDETVARLAAAGFPVVEGTDDDRRARRVERLASVMSPLGMPVELVLGLESAPAPYASPLVPGGFSTDGVGFGHVALAVTQYDEAIRFLTEGLGFGQSDWLEMLVGPGFELQLSFFHCNERHHTFALVRAPFEMPQRLHHVMLETNERDDVGAAFDRAWATDLPIPNGLGVHDNDRMFSFYVAGPAGFAVEIGHGARTITDDWDDNRKYDRISVWGHQPLRQG